MSKRKKIPETIKKRILEKNNNQCCVCKAHGIGFNLHHIDGNPSNNNDNNIALLCVKEHDKHHRPNVYSSSSHMELSSDVILRYKENWELFVEESRKENPKTLAVITAYGSVENIQGMKIVFQWNNEKIEYQKVYHMLDERMESCVDKAIEEVTRLSTNIKIVLIDTPLPVEYCEDCFSSFSRVLNEFPAKCLTEENWTDSALACIFINPEQASLACSFYYEDEHLHSISIHKCGNDIHLTDGRVNERYPILNKSKTSNQTKKIVLNMLSQFNISKVIYGTGNYESPIIIEEFELPEKLWNELKVKKRVIVKKRKNKLKNDKRKDR